MVGFYRTRRHSQPDPQHQPRKNTVMPKSLRIRILYACEYRPKEDVALIALKRLIKEIGRDITIISCIGTGAIYKYLLQQPLAFDALIINGPIPINNRAQIASDPQGRACESAIYSIVRAGSRNHQRTPIIICTDNQDEAMCLSRIPDEQALLLTTNLNLGGAILDGISAFFP